MPIPESQLETWAKQGAVAGSRDTYATVRAALEEGKYQGGGHVFLQGSYGNDTNIYAESDVDVVIRTDAFFYYDLTFLSDSEKAAFHAAYPDCKPGSYTYGEFKAAVPTALRNRFGSASRSLPRVASGLTTFRGNTPRTARRSTRRRTTGSSRRCEF